MLYLPFLLPNMIAKNKYYDQMLFYFQEEDLALYVIPMEQAITLVRARGLHCEVQMVKDVINKPKLALVIHGTEKYFRCVYLKSRFNVLIVGFPIEMYYLCNAQSTYHNGAHNAKNIMLGQSSAHR